jgi:hypothetical protein
MLWIAGGAVGLLAVAVTAMFIISMTYEPQPGREAPKVTDWMQAWSGIGAVLAGIAAAIFTAGLLLHEMRQAREARADAKRERDLAAADRARLEQERVDAIKAPARSVLTGSLEIGRMASSGEISNISLDLWNHGPNAISRVVVSILSRNDSISLDMIDVVAANSNVKASRNFFNPNLYSPEIYSKLDLRTEVRFTDHSGRHWRRVDNGQPELTSYPARDTTQVYRRKGIQWSGRPPS